MLVLVSTAIAAAIGIPLGILAARRPSIAKPIVALANLAQTIPSLALFGFLIPLPFVGGIGTRTALVALTVYAILPVLRGTITGIQGVPAPVIECAVAMGLTPRQVLTQVRVAAGVAVDRVGPARRGGDRRRHGDDRVGDRRRRARRLHLPRPGDGGLDGDPRRRGAGGAAGARLRRRARAGRPARRSSPAIAARAVAARGDAGRVGGRGGVGLRAAAAGRDVIVGSKNFTEQIVLGEIVAQAIERQGLKVERRFNLGGTAIAHQALISGGIDTYVEYSGTSLTAIFNLPPSTDANQVFAQVRDRYAALGVTALPRLGFNNTFAILVRAEDAERLGLKTIGDLNKFAGARAGFGYEFLERPDGFKGLSAAYGLQLAGQPRTMDLNLIYRAVAANEIDVTAGDATSGQIDVAASRRAGRRSPLFSRV